jgi:NAD(P)H-flavin reductase
MNSFSFRFFFVSCDRFIVHHILSQPDGEWKGETGHIRGELLQRLLPALPPKNNLTETLVCVCGPTEFSKLADEYVEINQQYLL